MEKAKQENKGAKHFTDKREIVMVIFLAIIGILSIILIWTLIVGRGIKPNVDTTSKIEYLTIEELKQNIKKEEDNKASNSETKGDSVKAQTELITSDSIKIDYNKKLKEEDIKLTKIILAKSKKDDQNIKKTNFNNGEFTDQEKLSLIELNADYAKNKVKYTDGPQGWISLEDAQNISQRIFDSKIDLSKVTNEINENKIFLTLGNGYGIANYKVESLIHDKQTGIYTLKFNSFVYPDGVEISEHSKKIMDPENINYTKSDVEHEYVLKYKEDNGKILISMDRIS